MQTAKRKQLTTTGAVQGAGRAQWFFEGKVSMITSFRGHGNKRHTFTTHEFEIPCLWFLELLFGYESVSFFKGGKKRKKRCPAYLLAGRTTLNLSQFEKGEQRNSEFRQTCEGYRIQTADSWPLKLFWKWNNARDITWTNLNLQLSSGTAER